MMKYRNISIFFCSLLIAGCATVPPTTSGAGVNAPTGSSLAIPVSIANAPANDFSLPQVRNNINIYEGAPLRWGGTIVSLVNEPGWTRIEVQAYPLNKDGQPQVTATSLGRFMVRADIPFDTEVYERNRPITVAGTLQGAAAPSSARQTLALPLIKADALYLWGESADPGESYQAALAPRVDPDDYPSYRTRGYERYPWYIPGVSLGLGYCRGCGGWAAFPSLYWPGTGLFFGFDR